MKYKLSVFDNFSSAHFLRQYKGKCENLHGHNWKVRVCLTGSKLDSSGMLIDFTDIKKHLSVIMTSLDHKCLNETPPFDKINPTAENIATYIFEQIQKLETGDINIYEVEVWESETSSAIVNK
jgi:6-pyruvoyltetrahydropterin/6-carboxytetrahydropterin synthase